MPVVWAHFRSLSQGCSPKKEVEQDLDKDKISGNNPSSMTLSMNGVPLPWVSKVKYLGVSFLCNTGKTVMSDTIRKFYSQFSNIMSVLGKGSQEMNAVHLMKTYCLPTLSYGIENSAICDNTRHKIQGPDLQNILRFMKCLQCFDAVGWAAGRASGL